MSRLATNPILVLAAAVVVFFASAAAASALLSRPAHTPGASAAGGCRLGNGIQHVVYLVFDNVHLQRDDPNVPSDLEQMPNLYGFLRQNGALLAGNHTPLIAHTAGDIITGLTGLYPDHHGQAVSNTYRFYNPDGSLGTGSSFTYWTARVYDSRNPAPADTTYNLLAATGGNAPAPWVPFTRAGCSMGAVGVANTVLENTGTDIPTVFGAGSEQAQQAVTAAGQASSDFVGVAIHCPRGAELCSPQNGGRPDLLPDEPGGYHGYSALFGHRYVAPQIAARGILKDLGGETIRGFPGFGALEPVNTLAYVLAMQEHGVPVTFGYLSAAHQGDPGSRRAVGPGEAPYERRLRSFDHAFGVFFERLKGLGLDPGNTLFAVSADEGDHFAGGPPSPAGCDGVRTACTYPKLGEVSVNLGGLLEQAGVRTPFGVHADTAPAVWVTGPARTSATAVRQLERAALGLTAVNPLSGKEEVIADAVADGPELKLLHMVTADPLRTPSFVIFAKPDYFLFTAAGCTPACVSLDDGFAWNHGGLAPEINTTWLALAGPGVRKLGRVEGPWADQTDIRPTLLLLLGLKDGYAGDGRPLFELLEDSALPDGLRSHRESAAALGGALKKINAPVGDLGLATLRLSTAAIASSSPGDARYLTFADRLARITEQRDGLAARMRAQLDGAAFGGRPFDDKEAKDLAAGAASLLNEVEALASGSDG
ncbi:MAG TPA: hypothetical protein VK131_09495 [Candidatus Acidoferrales bacterium]|nr:hypothetical protein [Candidatus Acidoferrales bacterium]